MDFKYQMERDILYVMEKEQQILQEDSISTIKNKVIQYNINLLEEFRCAMDDDELERACEALATARQVIIFAEGGSASMANYAKASFIHTGIYCRLEVDASMQVMAAEYVTHEDVVIGITHSGRITNTIEAMGVAQNRGATTIALVGSHGTPVCKYADIVLAGDIDHPFDLSDFQGSRLEEFSVLSVLQIGVMMRNHEEAIEVAKRVSDSAELRRLKKN
ncbi:MAG: MurR/RpiR family transcriptional regulator [Lachnospiraceae bacterium]|nr:MurR/RpiR family transcriptional regulator [Lachnospiraceae bacterium]